ncbi:MAG: hypothetical protein Q4D21_10465 [Phascolarctobacterium sp.]|nr:hypothetical protein [Phascolarctobacterium sp.]
MRLMINFLKNILTDKEIKNTALNRLFKIITGPITILFITMFLLPVEQGYWYAFTGLSALSTFAYLGFSTIILQFSAHEFSFLHTSDDGGISGDEEHIHRLGDFLRFVVRWLTRVVSVVFVLIMAGGYFFITQKGETTVDWVAPWFIYAVFSALVFFYSSILCFIEGCDKVAQTQLIRLKVSIGVSIVLLSLLWCGTKLYALAFSLVISALMGFYFLYRDFKCMLLQLWQISYVQSYDWKPEFYRLIWRYAISWCSGYFALQVYSPLVFNYYGAIEAGQVGISMAACTAGFSIADAFISSKLPKINMFIAKKEWHSLDILFKRNLLLAVVTFSLGTLCFWLLHNAFYDRVTFFQRFMSPLGLGILMLCWLLQLLTNSLAVYIRAHKIEPLYWSSLFWSLYVFGTTFYIVKNYSCDYLFLGFLSGNILNLPYVYYIYRLQQKIDLESR